MQPFTVTEPFTFSSQAAKGADERTEKVRLEVERARMEECTFAPQTNEASVEMLLARAGGGGGYASGGGGDARKSEGYARKADGYARK